MRSKIVLYQLIVQVQRPEDICKEQNNFLGSRRPFWLGYICWHPCDGIDASSWVAMMLYGCGAVVSALFGERSHSYVLFTSALYLSPHRDQEPICAFQLLCIVPPRWHPYLIKRHNSPCPAIHFFPLSIFFCSWGLVSSRYNTLSKRTQPLL